MKEKLFPEETDYVLPYLMSTHEYHQPGVEMPKKDVLMQIMGSLWCLCHCYMTLPRAILNGTLEALTKAGRQDYLTLLLLGFSSFIYN